MEFLDFKRILMSAESKKYDGPSSETILVVRGNRSPFAPERPESAGVLGSMMGKIGAQADEILGRENLGMMEELLPPDLLPLLSNLYADFSRGMVLLNETVGVQNFQEGLKKDRHAGLNWKQVQDRLLADNASLLRRANLLQGGGELIGVYPDGALCLIDRADANGDREPVIIAFNDDGERLTITADIRNREELLDAIRGCGGRFATCSEIAKAVQEDGFTLPPDLPGYEKLGLVAAVEAVSGKPFVSSKGGKDVRKALLTKGQMVTGVSQRVIVFQPGGGTYVGSVQNLVRYPNLGAVRVLRG